MPKYVSLYHADDDDDHDDDDNDDHDDGHHDGHDDDDDDDDDNDHDDDGDHDDDDDHDDHDDHVADGDDDDHDVCLCLVSVCLCGGCWAADALNLLPFGSAASPCCSVSSWPHGEVNLPGPGGRMGALAALNCLSVSLCLPRRSQKGAQLVKEGWPLTEQAGLRPCLCCVCVFCFCQEEIWEGGG